ncbi:MAG: hypothetical protein IJP38_06770, partial [Oscillospiraceae bacterium]|nr:hypothetical protein [Oscillospiraceae bacterium]
MKKLVLPLQRQFMPYFTLFLPKMQEKSPFALVYKRALFGGRSDRARTCGLMVPKNLGVPLSAYFRPFPPLSARKHILSGTLTSTVSVYSGRVCGIDCGQ